MSEWISVKDQLPDDDRFYLCVVEKKDGRKLMMVCWYNPAANGGTGSWINYGKQNVIYWRELPEMPEEA